MTDWTTYAVTGRVLERLLVVCFAGLSVYLGYRLFLQIPNVRDAQGEVKLPSMNMTMKVSRVGPGIFFAIFGVAVLLASFVHSISIETEPKSGSAAANAQAVAKFTGAVATQTEQEQLLRHRILAHNIGALNGLQKIISEKFPSNEASDSLTTIRDVKVALMDSAWDQSWGDPAAFKDAVWAGRTPDDKTIDPRTEKAFAFYLQPEEK